ncbi:MAG: TrkH family potassium uptake protein [Oscillospiraceae bacterium]|nr:TrkH family potassium uptake protein [Oscillospiraceae bacterium]
MNKRLVFKVVGISLLIEAAFLLLPLLIALFAKSGDAPAFAVTALACAALGFPLSRLKTPRAMMQNRDGYAAVALCWVFLSALGALPYALSGCCSYVDALFETVSGFTTTGATIFSAPSALPRGVQFWRALTQWMGGMGVLVLLLALLPKLGGGSVNLMKAESPGPISSKLLPRTADTAKALYVIYIALTSAETLLLRIAGMPWFDAVTTSFTTISTGGFSIRDTSIAYYESEAIVWIVTFFMFVSAINFSLLFLACVQRKVKEALQSEELHWYALIVLGASALIAVQLHFYSGLPAYTAVSHSVFQVVSLITTTGFATADFALWPFFSQALLITVMFIGGCAGSTGGGIKVSRILLLFKSLRRDLRRTLHPHEVRPITLDGKRVEESTVSSISLFFFAYLVILLLSAVVVSTDALTFGEAFSAALTCISNVGPGIGALGPTSNFGALSDLSTFLLTWVMLLGRLEIIPVLILFFPSLWKKK